MTRRQIYNSLMHCSAGKCSGCDLHTGDGYECILILASKAAKVIRKDTKTIKELRRENAMLLQELRGGNKDGLA